jgi:Mg2+ and Co2+ transporter CorA
VSILKHRADQHEADRKYQLELRRLRQEWDEKADERQQQEKALVHTENAEQTKAWTERFTRLMDGYDARVEDLMHEVMELRKEVFSLRRMLDWQRQACVGCPKLVQYGVGTTDGPN